MWPLYYLFYLCVCMTFPLASHCCCHIPCLVYHLYTWTAACATFTPPWVEGGVGACNSQWWSGSHTLHCSLPMANSWWTSSHWWQCWVSTYVYVTLSCTAWQHTNLCTVVYNLWRLVLMVGGYINPVECTVCIYSSNWSTVSKWLHTTWGLMNNADEA